MLLRDLDADGKPAANRQWRQVYGQLVGTVLSVWDAQDLEDAALASTTTVKPTYINVADASFRLIDSLPASGPSAGPVIANVIALSTTFKNRFLLQFPARSTMLTWAAALRLALFESVSLQEAYSGALLAARGSKISDIRLLLQETKFKHQDWVVVRFGAGMPWTRCWAVITPPGYKKKKKNKHGRIDFYDSQKDKQKKRPPLATVTAAVALYAVFPESCLLIDQSTLLKIEATIIVNNVSENTATAPRRGFIFVMPEMHPGVHGFQTLIRFLIPAFDCFGLYGRPDRFNADKADPRSLMFGLPDPPTTRYVDLADVYDVYLARPYEDDWTDQNWRASIKQVIVHKMASGTRHLQRTLTSEPDRTPILPSSEHDDQAVNAIGNQLHSLNLSIRRAAPPAPVRHQLAPSVDYVEPDHDHDDIVADDIFATYAYDDEDTDDDNYDRRTRATPYPRDSYYSGTTTAASASADSYSRIPRSPPNHQLSFEIASPARQQQEQPQRRVSRKQLPNLLPSSFTFRQRQYEN
ncbi:hypothetical protein V1514DRAFT_330287 [Lipomyces japonicus]|uniref:uncharacterized protein n=1 Tax=Lipomyces japonicus TaxID=56871 RepID=UPI0034CE5B56